MAGEKAVNYTAEQTDEIVGMYTAGTTVEQIAEKVGRTARSVIAKLSREGVYKSKAKANGEKRVTKAELVEAIGASLGANAEQMAELKSLEKASLNALKFLGEEFVNFADQNEVTDK